MERNPFPAVCGRICVHPCEFKCRRGELDEPVAIRSLKRYATDWHLKHAERRKESFPVTMEQKVAVVGAGPAGLTCAYFLAKMGYSVTVFEAQPLGGGMLGLTVPEFRLPREVIQAEIDYIESCGVEIRYKSPIDAHHTVNDLLKEGYHAVFIAAGAQASKRIGILGEDEGLRGLYYGLNFLTDVKSAQKVELTDTVVVVGGGNVAVDVARTACRIGAKDVRMFCLEARDEMPAWEKEVVEAMEEGIILKPSWGPKRILNEKGAVTGMEFVRCVSVLDGEGRFNPVFDEDTRQTVETGSVIISIGQAPDVSFLSRDSQLEMALWRGSLKVDENTLSTNVPGVFAGGDFTTGPTFLIRAIASGRRAALAINRYLQGKKGRLKIVDEKSPLHVDHGLALEEESTDQKPRAKPVVEKAEERTRDFREVEKGFSEEEAWYEAKRCLRCDLERAERDAEEGLENW
jgi:NADH-quinone oxidoreductase subunit F